MDDDEKFFFGTMLRQFIRFPEKKVEVAMRHLHSFFVTFHTLFLALFHLPFRLTNSRFSV